MPREQRAKAGPRSPQVSSSRLGRACERQAIRRDALRRVRPDRRKSVPFQVLGPVAELVDAADLKSAAPQQQPPEQTDLTNEADQNLVSCLAFLRQELPELAALVEGWSVLPDAVRARIVAMVEASAQR